MEVLNDVIQRCHKRHAERESLRQRKTVVSLALYKQLPYQVKVHCARSTPFTLDKLEKAEISFMPMGHASENDRPPHDFGGKRFKKRQSAKSWEARQWYDSWGIQIYTGAPSGRDGAHWHDLQFTYQAICDAPEAVLSCIETLLNTTASPLLTLTNSGGIRFSCRIQNYLHPYTDQAKYFIYKQKSTEDNPDNRDIYLEVRGDEGYSQWDMRYEILLGNLLEPPITTKELLLAPIERLREAIHQPEVSPGIKLDISKAPDVTLPAFGSANLELAKDAFLKRGFTYLREHTGFYHWLSHPEQDIVTEVSLWEDNGVVWIRAATPIMDIPTTATPITEMWDDTGISPKTPVSDKIQAIRDGHLSPLAIRRTTPKLKKQQSPQKKYITIKKQAEQLKQIFKSNKRILALISSEARVLDNTEAEKFLLNNYPTCLNIASRSLADLAKERYHLINPSSCARWRSRLYLWEQVKDIPVDIRMANPFRHRNVCEDAERCTALEKKGGNPDESICPKCPVYTECQEHGYLSHPRALQQAHAKISEVGHLFLEPRFSQIVENILGARDEQEHICIIDERKTSIEDMFFECVIPKKVIQEWHTNWQGHPLGNFAIAVMNAIEARGELYSNPIGLVRTAVEAFKQHEDEIIQQMCYINVLGKIVERKTVDTKTGMELSRNAIQFQCGTTAHIPLDATAENRLRKMGLQTLSPETLSRTSTTETELTTHEHISIPIQMTEAIALGFFDIQTEDKIEALPTVCSHPEWTYWHQLRHFFAHYPRDADAPMQWSDKYLTFWLPPKLHPNVKKLLLTTTFFTEQQCRKLFPDEDIEVVRLEPTAWKSGNKLFQIRTSSKSHSETLIYNSNTDNMELTIVAERYLLAIQAEIERKPDVNHAIVSNKKILNKLTDLAAKPNVCFVENYKAFLHKDINTESVQVIWLVGMPQWAQRSIWYHAQMLFGNEGKPLNYDGEIWTHDYQDARIQTVYNQNVVGVLTQVIGRLGLNCSTGKTVMLLNNFELPDITDRPQTLLFDWEDYEIAGDLDKLEETIRIRERFESERDSLTAESSRKEVERILGCSSRHANRVLQKLGGGKIPRISFREQILHLLSFSREKTTASLVAAIDSSPQAIGNELKRLLDEGKIVRVRRGVYSLPENHQQT